MDVKTAGQTASDLLLPRLAEAAEAIDDAIATLLPESDLPEAQLYRAMRHATLGSGKRVRPFLLLETAALFGVNRDCALRAAAAIEFMHCYSLVHDDLPAMDDAETRRGRATVHVTWDEATAILAGDALQSLAFEVLASEETHEDPAICVRLVRALARAAGPHGMAGGQMLDLLGERSDIEFDATTITRMQQMKTGALIAFSCEAGAILGRADPSSRIALRAYAHDLGLAFQITDDLMDIDGEEAQTGKPTGRDAAAGKATFVAILGEERARAQAALLCDQAAKHLEVFGQRAENLALMARWVRERQA